MIYQIGWYRFRFDPSDINQRNTFPYEYFNKGEFLLESFDNMQNFIFFNNTNKYGNLCDFYLERAAFLDGIYVHNG